MHLLSYLNGFTYLPKSIYFFHTFDFLFNLNSSIYVNPIKKVNLLIRRPRPSPRPGRRLGPPQVWNFSARALNVRGSFHQAWPSAFAAPGLQPALCLHIPRGSFHQAPGRQRSSIAACPLPAHRPLLLGHSSLPFARLQTPTTPKTPKTLPCLHIGLSCWGIRACRLPGFKPLQRLKPLKRSLACT